MILQIHSKKTVEIEEGDWTPELLNCKYTKGAWTGKYLKIGKCVKIWFHVRALISELLNEGTAVNAGLPYKPTWPQGSGTVSTCYLTETDYVPNLIVSPDVSENGGLVLSNNWNGDSAVKWKVLDWNGWLIGRATYWIE